MKVEEQRYVKNLRAISFPSDLTKSKASEFPIYPETIIGNGRAYEIWALAIT